MKALEAHEYSYSGQEYKQVGYEQHGEYVDDGGDGEDADDGKDREC